MTAVDTRPPLYLTAGEAASWMSLHSEDRGREIIIVEWKPAPVPPEMIGKPPRMALGHNAQGQWVWLDAEGNPEGDWP